MKQHVSAYFAILTSVIILDGIWLSLTISRYQKHLSHVLMDRPLWWPVAIFYLLYAFGLYFVVVRTAATNDARLISIFISGMVFGMTAYGTYDLTNQATIKGWPTFITIIDLIWGALLSGISALAGAWTMRLFK